MSELLNYRYPPILPAGSGISANNEQWHSTLPLNGYTFRSDNTASVVFNIASNSEFLRTTQSFLTGKLTPYAADNSIVTTGTANSWQGVSRAFSRMQIKVGGVVVEDLQYYSDLLALYYSGTSQHKRSLLGRMEGFGKTDWFTAGPKKFAHAIMSSLWISDQSLPLPLIQSSGGVTIELFLAPASELFTSSNVAYYTLEPQMKWLGVTPDPAFTISLISAVKNAGKSAYIPYQKVHFYPSAGNGSSTQNINVAVGQVSSIAGIQTVFMNEADLNDRTKDKYGKFSSAGLIDYRIEGAGQNNPSQLTFKHEGGADPETLLLAAISQTGNIYNIDQDMDQTDDFATYNFRIALTFQSDNEHFATGLSTLAASSPFLTITTTHSAPVPGTTRILSIVTCDALIEFRGSEIAVSEVF